MSVQKSAHEGHDQLAHDKGARMEATDTNIERRIKVAQIPQKRNDCVHRHVLQRLLGRPTRASAAIDSLLDHAANLGLIVHVQIQRPQTGVVLGCTAATAQNGRLAE